MSYEAEQNLLLKLWEGVGSDIEPFIDAESEEEEQISGEDVPNTETIECEINKSEEEDEQEEETEESEDENVGTETNNRRNSRGKVLYGKDKTKWIKIPASKCVRTRSENIITHLPGVKALAKDKKTAIECWQLYFPDYMLNDIVRHTNTKIATNASKYADVNKYIVKETNIQEIKAVIGLLYLCGLYKSNRQNTSDLWCTDGTGLDIFRTTMSQQRFYFLLQCLRFDNIHNRAERKQIDKLAPIRSIFDNFVENCKSCYTPSEYVTIDEKLESFRGRVSFLQYIPNKPAKYGLKVFALVDAKTYYCLNMEVYVGMQPEGPFRQSNKPQDIVERLIIPISGSKRNVTFDNWFTSYPLMKNLLKTHKLTSVGTIRKNKTQIPKAFLNSRKREPCSSLFGFQEDITAVSYVPKKYKNVILFSTLHHDDTIIENSDKKLPEIIHFYNCTKGGVDTLDEMSANYNVSRNSRRWPLTLFYSLLNTAGVNSQVIYKANTNQFNLKRRLYLKTLGMELIADFRNSRIQNLRLPRNLRPSTSTTATENPTKRQKVKSRCSVCPRNQDRKTSYTCMQCSVPLCLEHANLKCKNCSDFEIE